MSSIWVRSIGYASWIRFEDSNYEENAVSSDRVDRESQHIRREPDILCEGCESWKKVRTNPDEYKYCPVCAGAKRFRAKMIPLESLPTPIPNSLPEEELFHFHKMHLDV